MSKSTVSRPILGQSPAVQEMLKVIQKVAKSKTNVLITGESGTGKELVARMIHDIGPLVGKPFIPVNCGAIPETLIESEMFGHKKGSFTGAVQDKMGLFEVAHGGTLFLDEVGELPLSMQVKLLRALQEKMIKKVGSTEDIQVDVRIIAATNRDLEVAVTQGSFREDLYYRLNVILIKTPPLRERVGDVKLLAEYFLNKSKLIYSSVPEGFEPEVFEALEKYDWPGNVRELENVIERAVALQGSQEKVRMNSLPSVFQNREMGVALAALTLPDPSFKDGPLSLEDLLTQVERFYLLSALKKSDGSEQGAAKLLKVSLRWVQEKVKSIKLVY